MAKKGYDKAKDQERIDWTRNLSKYKGWHLLYAQQCPWHEKAVHAIQEVAEENDIDLK
jgi:hypothetical protein